jgi:hypothetical protein
MELSPPSKPKALPRPVRASNIGNSYGTGVPREAAPKITATAQQAEEIWQVTGDSEYRDEPTYADQLARYPHTCKVGPVVTAVFELAPASKHLGEYNEFLSQETPEGAPRVQCVRSTMNWSEAKGCYVLLYQYQRIGYRVLVKSAPTQQTEPADDAPTP